MLSEKRRRHQNRHDGAPDHSTVSIHNGANFADRYIEMHMLRVQLSMRTEGIKAFSKRIRVVVRTRENDTKTKSVDANLYFFKTEQSNSVFV